MENERAPLLKFAIGTKTASKYTPFNRADDVAELSLYGLMKLHCFSNQQFIRPDINFSGAFVFVLQKRIV